jgi:hypothetical protein
MRDHCWLSRGAKCFAPLLILFVILVTLFILPGSADADGGVAISGSFSQQVFELAQGSSVSVSSVYVAIVLMSGCLLRRRWGWLLTCL